MSEPALPEMLGSAAPALALLAAAATGWLAVDDRPRLGARRLARALAGRRSRSPAAGLGPPSGRSRRSPSRPTLACVLAGIAVAVLTGGTTGIVAGLVVAALGRRLLARLEPAPERARRQRIAADLPFAADLLAACLSAGRPLPEAVAAVAGVLDGPLGLELAGVARRLHFGAEPARTWRALGGHPELASLARTVARAAESGAALADDLRRLADDRRRHRRFESTARAHRVGIRATAPLGLCFLPAFVLLGIVPLVAGITRTILGLGAP